MTREQVMQWAKESGLDTMPGGLHFEWSERNAIAFATLARADLEAIIAEQTKQLEEMAEAIMVTAELMREVETNYFALLKKKGAEAEQLKAEDDMYGWNFHTGMRSGAVTMHLYLTKLIKALSIQPSPDLLRERDARLVERIAKLWCESDASFDFQVIADKIREGTF